MSDKYASIDEDSDKKMSSYNNGAYKEYKFMTESTPDVEKKISQFWKEVDLTNLSPYKPKKRRSKSIDGELDNRCRSCSCEIVEKSDDKMSWLDTLIMLRKKGLEKEARAATNEFCKLCINNEIGKTIYADEAYEDRYIKKMMPNELCN